VLELTELLQDEGAVFQWIVRITLNC